MSVKPVRKRLLGLLLARTSCRCLCHLCLQPAGDYQLQPHLPLRPIGFSLLARPGARFQRELDDNSWMAHTLWSIKGEAAESQRRRNYGAEEMCGENCLLPLPTSLAASACVILSFMVRNIQLSKSGFVTLQIYQMRSMSTFLTAHRFDCLAGSTTR